MPKPQRAMPDWPLFVPQSMLADARSAAPKLWIEPVREVSRG